MHQYIQEKQYSDIFSTVQILVAMTPNRIKYMANTTADLFNKDFAFEWQNPNDNKVVRNWTTFADMFLSIPMAHQNVYIVLLFLMGLRINRCLRLCVLIKYMQQKQFK